MEMSLYQSCSAFHVHTGDVPSLGGFRVVREENDSQGELGASPSRM